MSLPGAPFLSLVAAFDELSSADFAAEEVSFAAELFAPVLISSSSANILASASAVSESEFELLKEHPVNTNASAKILIILFFISSIPFLIKQKPLC